LNFSLQFIEQVLTRDSVTVAVDAVVYYRIYNPVVAITNVEDADRSTRLLAATTLRNVLGTKNLSEILSERDTISGMMQTMLDEATDPWGVKVERVEVKDVRLPVQLQRAMAAEAEAAREARAKVIAAEGEWKASRALKEAADVITESPFAVQLRYLQTLSTISAEKNSTIIFPLPVDLVTHFMHNNHGSNNTVNKNKTKITPPPRLNIGTSSTISGGMMTVVPSLNEFTSSTVKDQSVIDNNNNNNNQFNV
ncbi:erythrocyte band 7 integral membrane protein, partial [Schistosoma bovis]